MSRVVIVGEVNPYHLDPSFALYHLPRHASGNKLREHVGLTDVQYERLQKINLCYGKWSMKEARSVAAGVIEVVSKYDNSVIVMLGAKVKKAFGCEHVGFFDQTAPDPNIPKLVALPHPSGLNRIWNEPDSRQKARDLLNQVCPWIFEA